MQEKLIFLHIPKNGGRTLHSILDRFYPIEKTFTIRVIDNHRLNRKEFIEMEQTKRDAIILLKGHMSFGMHKLMTGDAKYITFIRNPQQRIISYYYYVLMRKKHRLHAQVKSENMSLLDFTKTIKQGDLHNAQIRRISGIQDKPSLMLEKAMENIDQNFSFVGLTEKFDESLVLLQRLYNWPLPYYQIQNKTKNRPKTAEIDKATLDVIDGLNEGDHQLYRIIEKRINDQIIKSTGISADVTKLRIANRLYFNRLTNFWRNNFTS